MSISDEQLIKRTLSGSRAAFGQLITRYQGFVFSLCFKVLDQREEAEEAAQDVFLKLFDRLDSFREESRFKTWLYTLTYRTAIDYRRSRKPMTLPIEDHPLRTERTESRLLTADFSTQQGELRKVLDQVIAKLPREEGLIIQLFYLQEQSVREIAEILEMSVTNVKTKLFRTREKMRKLLKRQLGKEFDLLRF